MKELLAELPERTEDLRQYLRNQFYSEILPDNPDSDFLVDTELEIIATLATLYTVDELQQKAQELTKVIIDGQGPLEKTTITNLVLHERRFASAYQLLTGNRPKIN